MSNADTSKSGFDDLAAERNRKATLEFQCDAQEIEDLLVQCIAEQHCSCKGSEVQSLIQEWKALYRRKLGEDISQEEFNSTEIGKFICGHQAYDEMKRLL